MFPGSVFPFSSSQKIDKTFWRLVWSYDLVEQSPKLAGWASSELGKSNEEQGYPHDPAESWVLSQKGSTMKKEYC